MPSYKILWTFFFSLGYIEICTIYYSCYIKIGSNLGFMLILGTSGVAGLSELSRIIEVSQLNEDDVIKQIVAINSRSNVFISAGLQLLEIT